jgi:hypothetical protein
MGCFRFLNLSFPDALFPRIWVPRPRLEALQSLREVFQCIYIQNQTEIMGSETRVQKTRNMWCHCACYCESSNYLPKLLRARFPRVVVLLLSFSSFMRLKSSSESVSSSSM